MRFGRCALWPTFSRNPRVRFWIFFANRKCVRPTIDPENLNKIALQRFEQISLKVGKKRDISLFSEGENILSPAAVTMG